MTPEKQQLPPAKDSQPALAPSNEEDLQKDVAEKIANLEIDEMRRDKFEAQGRKRHREKKQVGAREQWDKTSSGEGDFIKRMGAILDLKGRKVDIREIFSVKKHKGLRINPLLVQSPEGVKKIRDELVSHGIDLVHLTWYPDAFIVPVEQIEKITSLSLYEEGLIFIQNPSSFLPILALDPRPGERYLDVCSAPGGKAALYAGLSRGMSQLYLVDDNPFRVNKKMRPVLDSQRVVPKEIIICDARHLIIQGKIDPESFDKVLVDVDCSSEGKINFESKDPLKQWRFKDAVRFSNLQLKILTVGYDALKPGGVLVYSTCTLAPEENEGVISRFLKKKPDAMVQKLTFRGQKTYGPITNWPGQEMVTEVARTLRVHPKDPYMEGFFLCRIIKPLPVDDSPQGKMNEQKNRGFENEVVDLDELAQKHSVLKGDDTK